jgi:urease accessory protein
LTSCQAGAEGKPPNAERRTSNAERGGRGLRGHLELVCGLDAAGSSSLRRQSFCAPVHLSKPHLDAGVLVVNVVNPTAGLLAGDRVHYSVQVETRAALMLTTPSASRVHRMPDGYAEVRQDFQVAAGGWLECWPELMIPQSGARYHQQTSIRIEKGGELLFFETLAPGRVASGETFGFDELIWATDLFHGVRQIARERYRLSPGNGSLTPLRTRFPTAYYASAFVVTPHLAADAECWARIHELHAEDAWIGVSALAEGAWVVKLLAADSLALRRKIGAVRAEIHAALRRPVPSPRRF